MIMSMELMVLHCHVPRMPSAALLSTYNHNIGTNRLERLRRRPTMVMVSQQRSRNSSRTSSSTSRIAAAAAAGEGLPLPPLDLTEDNIRLVLADARVELAQIFDTSVGMTGEIDLAELDGPFVKISLKGRFWHKRSTVVARVGNYLKQRIPEILEVDIEDEKQLDDSPESF